MENDDDRDMTRCARVVWLGMWVAVLVIFFVCSTGCTPADAAVALLNDLATAVGQMGDQVDVLAETVGEIAP